VSKKNQTLASSQERKKRKW